MRGETARPRAPCGQPSAWSIAQRVAGGAAPHVEGGSLALCGPTLSQVVMLVLSLCIMAAAPRRKTLSDDTERGKSRTRERESTEANHRIRSRRPDTPSACAPPSTRAPPSAKPTAAQQPTFSGRTISAHRDSGTGRGSHRTGRDAEALIDSSLDPIGRHREPQILSTRRPAHSTVGTRHHCRREGGATCAHQTATVSKSRLDRVRVRVRTLANTYLVRRFFAFDASLPATSAISSARMMRGHPLRCCG